MNGPRLDGTGVVRGQRVLIEGQLQPATIVFENGRITAIGQPTELPTGLELLDAGNGVVFPGLVDPHVHINEPGRTAWEGFESATRAAAKGGVTTLVDMPLNSIPATTDVAALESKRAAAAGKCSVDVGFWGGVVPGNQTEIRPLRDAGVLGFKAFLVDSGVEEFTSVSVSDLDAVAEQLVGLELPLLVHAELQPPIDRALAQLSHENERQYATYLASRPPAAETEAIGRMLEWVRRTGIRLHIVHLSSAEAVPMLVRARADGLPVTVETAPHYLFFESGAIADGRTEFKCAPPIRDHTNREQLWQALIDGTIDGIATDHSPCPPQDKLPESGDFLRAWGGIASLELSLAVVWTAARERRVALSRIAEWMSSRPAEWAGLDKPRLAKPELGNPGWGKKGQLAVGFDADIIVWHPERSFVVQADELAQRHPITPYADRELFGVVETTLLRGNTIWNGGEFSSEPKGRLLSP